jgi:hypothetical protein
MIVFLDENARHQAVTPTLSRGLPFLRSSKKKADAGSSPA